MLVGKKVKHIKYGIGIITKCNSDKGLFNVAFDEDTLSKVTINHSNNYCEETEKVIIVNIKSNELELI